MKKLLTLIMFMGMAGIVSAAGTASFTTSISGSNVTFTNTSTPPGGPGVKVPSYSWTFGDGGWAFTFNANHTYTASGTYVVTLNMAWYDSATSAWLGGDTTSDTITVIATGISGTVIRDSALGTVSWDSIKVWLITYDTATHIITAVDSDRMVSYSSHTPFSFTGVAPGSYLLKAAGEFGGGGSGFVPTYHYSSLSWSGGGYVTVSSGMVAGQDIYMQYGTLSTGPGFIGGDVTMGAGKGTAVGDPVAGLPIYLINTSTGKLVSATTTDAMGKYAFNVPYGTYTIQPEKGGLNTTVWSTITVDATHPSQNAISFLENSSSIKPKTAAIPPVCPGPVSEAVIYPNPAHDQLNISWNGIDAKTADISIINMAGQKVFSTTLSINAAGNSLNVSQMQAGVYFMNITAGQNTYSNKITIK